jgi:hypothetical protein
MLFAHVTWSPDSSRVGVCVVTGYGDDIKSAYDTRDQKQIPFSAVEDLVRDSIRSVYKLTPSDLTEYADDPLQWATGDDQAHTRFRKRSGRAETPPRVETRSPVVHGNNYTNYTEFSDFLNRMRQSVSRPLA